MSTIQTAHNATTRNAPRHVTASHAAPGARSGDGSPEILHTIQHSLSEDKAVDVVTFDLAGRSAMADQIVVASGTSRRQVGAMAEHIRDQLRDRGVKGVAVEGLAHCDWVLIDAGDVIVHLFRPEVRAFYDLESIWADPDGLGAAGSPTGYRSGTRGATQGDA